MNEWMKVDRDILINAKMMAAGRAGACLYLTVLGVNRSGDRDGHLLPVESKPSFLAFRSGAFRLTVVEASEGLEACLGVDLLSMAEDGGILIQGWDETWRSPTRDSERRGDGRKKKGDDKPDEVSGQVSAKPENVSGQVSDTSAEVSGQGVGQVAEPVRTGCGTLPKTCPDTFPHRMNECTNHSGESSTSSERPPDADDAVAAPVGEPEGWWATALAKFDVLADRPLLKSIREAALTSEEFSIVAPRARSPGYLAWVLRQGRGAIDVELSKARRAREAIPPPIDDAKREAVYEAAKRAMLAGLGR